MNHILFFLTRFTNVLQREFEWTGRNRKFKSHKEKKWNKRSRRRREKKWEGRALPKTFFKLFNVVLLTKQDWAAKKPCFTVLVGGKTKTNCPTFWILTIQFQFCAYTTCGHKNDIYGHLGITPICDC